MYRLPDGRTQIPVLQQAVLIEIVRVELLVETGKLQYLSVFEQQPRLSGIQIGFQSLRAPLMRDDQKYRAERSSQTGPVFSTIR